jgi:hypothetical protein
MGNAKTLYSTSYSDRYNQQLFSAIGSSRFVNVIENSQSSYSITSAISTYPNYNGINVNTVSQSHLAITGTVNNKHIIFGAFPKSGESTATVNSVLIRTPRKLGQLMLILER